jgi:hypothetical protein
MPTVADFAYDTVGGYLLDARTLLQDLILPYRYPTPTLIQALNSTLLEARRLRPDLFADYLDALPQYTWLDALDIQPNSDNQDDANPTWAEWVPIENQFRQAIIFGIVSHAMARDQEDIEDERATGHLKTFVNMLVGVDPTKGTQPTKLSP